MQSNVQQAREALGAHLRQLRREAGLNGKEFADRLGWPASKVSKLELGQQSPSAADLTSWASVAGKPDAAEALGDELAALETFYREYRRWLRSGMNVRQQEALEMEGKASQILAFESHYVPGLLQTAEYARYMLAKGARLHGAPDDVDDAVAVRMRRQDALYRPGKKFHFVVTEAVLRSRAAAPAEVMAAQLDRLMTATTLGPGVRFGVIPFDVQWPVFLDHGFWVIDNAFVVVENLTAELRLTRPEEVQTYARVFEQLAAIAAYGGSARAVITRTAIDLANHGSQ